MKEPILEPDLPIIDPHHHLWDRENWRYLHDDLLADTSSGHNIIATVFVQARAMLKADGPDEMKPVGEVEFVNGVAAMTASGIYGKFRACAGIVGHADMMLGSRVEPVLAALDRAGGGRFRGIRHITAYDADPQVMNPGNPAWAGMLADAKFREGAKTLARMGFSFDAWVYCPQLDDVTAFADAVPECPIVLNHCGGIVGINAYKKDEVFPVWKKSIEALAKRPNVYCEARRPRHAAVRPRIPHADGSAVVAATRRHVAALYGNLHRGVRHRTARCSRAISRSTRARTAIRCSGTHAKILAKGASASEKADLFVGAAKRFYKLDV